MAAPHSSPIAQAKAAARARAIIARAHCDPDWGRDLTRFVLDEFHIEPGAIVSGFWPMAGEIDIRPLLTALFKRRHPILLPETPPRGQPLIFRAWTPQSKMIRERFGTFRPDGPEAVPDIMFVPLLAFDRAGNRLGYGGGYYDRTIAALPGRPVIGCAFSAQELDAVPVDDYDAKLTAIVTERGILRF